MNQAAGTNVKLIGIVGGGRRGMNLYHLFTRSSSTKVAYVIDIDPSALAIVVARKDGIRTFTDLNAVRTIKVDFIFEVTGSKDAITAIREFAEPLGARVITHDMAKVILEVIQENDQKVKADSVREISGIKTDITGHLESLGRMVEEIEDIMSEMNMLAINARIEAARVGELGKGFGVVASQMGKSAASVKKITEEIERINQSIAKTSSRIDDALSRLE
jgi:hypothetical protein